MEQYNKLFLSHQNTGKEEEKRHKKSQTKHSVCKDCNQHSYNQFSKVGSDPFYPHIEYDENWRSAIDQDYIYDDLHVSETNPVISRIGMYETKKEETRKTIIPNVASKSYSLLPPKHGINGLDLILSGGRPTTFQTYLRNLSKNNIGNDQQTKNTFIANTLENPVKGTWSGSKEWTDQWSIQRSS